ncbi:histidine phosphatase family protein [Pseudooceanicola sp. HF7]|uniref:histidine phosphatase family protein n=1 Tax=Pseudooceanicola sp. HF7 TaxID=2721560 RepID=UPI00143030FB|nr:histidine phosphatase family protein [Pseudooceanicola sp. HF7]NIZ11442.1 histidine phosphatase family protein [Pseudooceanicola sp. HF7]
MGVLHLIRHGQASFGAADYDVLSDIGHRQSEALGRWFAAQGVVPDLVAHGGMRRQRETLEGIMGQLSGAPQPLIHPGLGEFDFKALLAARGPSDEDPQDRKAHFRRLRDTVLMWQRGEIADPPESWPAFAARVEDARQALTQSDGTVIAVSSGGAIGQMVSAALGAPPVTQIEVQLQTRNASVTRFAFSTRRCFLNGFNETPFVTGADDPLLTYS